MSALRIDARSDGPGAMRDGSSLRDAREFSRVVGLRVADVAR